MTSEKSKEDYYRDAAQYLNTGAQYLSPVERGVSDSGDRVGGTLDFLTRGRNHIFATLAVSDGFSRHPAASDGVHERSFGFF